MSYMSIKEVSKKWGISERRIMRLCQENRIDGAIKKGRVWGIPEETKKPLDKRSKTSSYVNVARRVMVVNLNTEIGYSLLPLLEKEGYIVEGICAEKSKIDMGKLRNVKILKTNFENRISLEKELKKTNRYYDGLIFIDTDKTSETFIKNKEWLVIQFVHKMNVESSIVFVNNRAKCQSQARNETCQKDKNKKWS